MGKEKENQMRTAKRECHSINRVSASTNKKEKEFMREPSMSAIAGKIAKEAIRLLNAKEGGVTGDYKKNHSEFHKRAVEVIFNDSEKGYCREFAFYLMSQLAINVWSIK